MFKIYLMVTKDKVPDSKGKSVLLIICGLLKPVQTLNIDLYREREKKTIFKQNTNALVISNHRSAEKVNKPLLLFTKC
jgi:hypothetical protein